MPALSNHRHEAFCQALADGISQQKAYEGAGFKPSLSNPSKLAKDARIVARLAEIRSKRVAITAKATQIAAEALAIDREWIMGRLKENVERAMQTRAVRDEEGNPIGEYRYDGAVANRGLELLGKEIGMFVERKSVSITQTIHQLSYAELEAIARSGSERDVEAPEGEARPDRVH